MREMRLKNQIDVGMSGFYYALSISAGALRYHWGNHKKSVKILFDRGGRIFAGSETGETGAAELKRSMINADGRDG